MMPRVRGVHHVLYSVMMNTKVYLSGGMNQSNWQQAVIDKVTTDGYLFYNPREHNLIQSKEYTIWDLFYVKQCDIVFAYMQDINPSGYGLSLEIGYAIALGKPVILIDEKSIDNEKFKQYFAFVRECASIVFNNLEDGINYLIKLRNGVVSVHTSRK